MRDKSGGFILVSSLAALALLSLLVTGSAMLVHSAAAGAEFARDRLIRDGLTQAGREIGAYQLFVLKRAPNELANQRLRLDSGVVTLSVEAESGKIDLNGADAEILAELWRQAGLGGQTPEAFASRVIDWRDRDDMRGPSGAERSDYAAAGRPGRPRNAAFETVDELQEVLGVVAADVVTLRDLLTVSNPEGKIAIFEAPRDVVRALPGISSAIADRIIQLRRAGAPAAEQIGMLLGLARDAVQFGEGAAFQIAIAVERPGSPSSQTRFIIVDTDEQSAAYEVIDVVRSR